MNARISVIEVLIQLKVMSKTTKIKSGMSLSLRQLFQEVNLNQMEFRLAKRPNFALPTTKQIAKGDDSQNKNKRN